MGGLGLQLGTPSESKRWLPVLFFAVVCLVIAAGGWSAFGVLGPTSAYAEGDNDLVAASTPEEDQTAYAILYENGDLIMQFGDEEATDKGRVLGKWTGFDAENGGSPWRNKSEKVKRFIVKDPVAPVSMREWLRGCDQLESCELSRLDISQTTTMEYLFSGCSSLTDFGLPISEAPNLTSMKNMFYGCSSLTSLAFSSFNTSSVTSMEGMFSGCSSLTSLNLRGFDTSSVTSMEAMFQDCSSLASLDLSSFDTSHVTNMYRTFSGCSSLTSLDLSSFDTSSVTGMPSMFQDCSSLASLDLSSFDTSSVTNMLETFSGCSSLTSLDLRGFDTSSVTSMYGMFSGCSSLASFIVGDCFKVIDTLDAIPQASFAYPHSGRWIRMQGGEPQTAIEMRQTEGGKLEPGTYVWYEPQDYSSMLSAVLYDSGKLVLQNGPCPDESEGEVHSRWVCVDECPTIAWSDEKEFITSVVAKDGMAPTTMASWFADCPNLLTCDFSVLDTSHVTSMSEAFARCSSLASLDLSSFDTSSVTIMDGMFQGCSSLAALDTSSFDTSSVTSMSDMFKGCSALNQVTLGENFEFKAAGSYNSRPLLPYPSTDYPYSGKWVRAEGGTPLTSYSLSQSYNGATMAGTYVWDMPEDEWWTWTILYASGDMVFQKGPGADPARGDVVKEWIGGDRSSNNAPWLEEAEAIKHVSFRDAITPETMLGWFKGCANLESCDFTNLDVSTKYYSLDYMFQDCSSLTSLDFSGLNIRLYNANYMFSGCTSLTSLDLTTFDTTSSYEMQYMFQNCTSLETLDLSSFDMSRVNKAKYMFGNCLALSSIVLGDKFSFVKQKEDYYHYSLNHFPYKNPSYPYSGKWIRSEGGKAMNALDLFDAYNETHEAGTYRWELIGESEDTWALLYSNGDLVMGQGGAFDTARDDVVGVWTGFENENPKSSYESRVPWHDARNDIKHVEMRSNVVPISTASWFWDCANLESADLTGLDASKIESMSGMFTGCTLLSEVDFGTIEAPKVTNLASMFSGCSSLTNLDLSSISTSNVTDMRSMFYGCSALEALDLSSFDTANVTNMASMFGDGYPSSSGYCKALSSVKLGPDFAFKDNAIFPGAPSGYPYTGRWKLVGGDYAGTASELAATYVGSTMAGTYEWDVPEDGDWTWAITFADGTLSLQGGSGVDPGVGDAVEMWVYDRFMERWFNPTTEETTTQAPWRNMSVALKRVVTSEGAFSGSMGSWFSGCKGLESADLSGLDMTAVTNISYLFSECESLTAVNLGTCDTSNVTSMRKMFYGCSSLTTLDLSSLDTSNVANSYDMFTNCAKLSSVKLGGTFTFGEGTALPEAPARYPYGGKWVRTEGGEAMTAADLASSYDGATMAGTYTWQLLGDDNWTWALLYSNGDLVIQAGSALDASRGAAEEKWFFDNGKWHDAQTGEAYSPSSGISVPWSQERESILRVEIADKLAPQSTRYWFYNCSRLESADLSKLDTTSTSDMYGMFGGCTSLSKLKLGASFSFGGQSVQLPNAPSAYPHTGKWVCAEDGSTFTSSELTGTFDGTTMAGVYAWEKAADTKYPWALLYSNGDLVLQNGGAADGARGEVVAAWPDFDKSDAWGVWSGYRSSIKKVEARDEIAPGTTRRWFYQCENLEDADLSKLDTSNVTSMGYMFYGCSSLTNVYLGEPDTSDVTSMEYMFYGCSSLTSVDFNPTATGGLTSISNMFNGCSSLAGLDLSSFDMGSVTEANSLFYGCSSLKTLSLPATMAADGANMYSNCSSLATVYIPTVDAYNRLVAQGSLNRALLKGSFVDPSGVRYLRGDGYAVALGVADEAVDVIVPICVDGLPVTSIGDYAFQSSNIESVAFRPEASLASVGSYAFYGCQNLVRSSLPASLASIGAHAFSGCTNLRTVVLSSESLTVGNSAFTNMADGSTIYVLSNQVSNAVSGKYTWNRTQVVVCSTSPSGEFLVSEDGSGRLTILGCVDPLAASVAIPAEVDGKPVVAIAARAFEGMNGMTSVTISRSVTTMGEGAFAGCSALRKITIPSSITEIPANAFAGCAELSRATLASTVTRIGEGAFSGCAALVDIVLPAGLNRLGARAFEGCASLAEATVPGTVTSIGSQAFAGCTSLAKADVAANVTSIPAMMFAGCSSLAEVSLPDRIASLEQGCFSGCSLLATIELPSALSTIGAQAFEGCDALRELDIPPSVWSIGMDSLGAQRVLVPTKGVYSKVVLSGYDPARIGGSYVAEGGLRYYLDADDVFISGYDGTSSEVVVPATLDGCDVTGLSPYAFAGCDIVKRVTMLDGTTSIGSNAFDGCEALRVVALPDSVTSIHEDAFAGAPDSLVIVCNEGSVASAFAETAGISTKYSGASMVTCTIDAMSPVVFAGIDLEPPVVVRHGDTVLEPGEDYAVSYANNVDVGTASVTVTGRGYYYGSTSATFAIEQADIADVQVKPIANQVYTGSEVEPVPTLSINGIALVEGVDFIVEGYDDNLFIGKDASVTVLGRRNFTGRLTVGFHIGHGISDAVVAEIPDQDFLGVAMRPTLDVSYGGKPLVEGEDFKVEYVGNDKPGHAEARIVACGDYAGERSETFDIRANLANAAFGEVEDTVYDGYYAEPAPELRIGSYVLAPGKDYDLSYEDNLNAGKAAVRAAGKGFCSGEAIAAFTIMPQDIGLAEISDIPAQLYTGRAITPTVTATLNDVLLGEEDYDVSYSRNVEAGDAEVLLAGKGNYTGEKIGTFHITRNDVADALIELASPQVYTGASLAPELVVTHGGKTLTRDVDYQVEYGNNVAAGMGVAYVAGIGLYAGEVTFGFPIEPLGMGEAELTLPEYATYTGSPVTVDVRVTHHGIELEEGVDYLLSFDDNVEPGTASVVAEGIGNYEGTASRTFQIYTESSLLTIAEGTCGPNQHWRLNGDYQLAVSGDGAMFDYAATGSAEPPWSSYKRLIREVVFEGSISSIGGSAFESCTALTSVAFPDGLETIGEHAFDGCTSLSHVALPDSLAEIGEGAFLNLMQGSYVECCKDVRDILNGKAAVQKYSGERTAIPLYDDGSSDTLWLTGRTELRRFTIADDALVDIFATLDTAGATARIELFRADSGDLDKVAFICSSETVGFKPVCLKAGSYLLKASSTYEESRLYAYVRVATRVKDSDETTVISEFDGNGDVVSSIAVGRPFVGWLHGSFDGDIDKLAFSAVAGKHYFLDITTEGETYVYVENATGKTVAAAPLGVTPTGRKSTTIIDIGPLQPGDYRVRIGAIGPYDDGYDKIYSGVVRALEEIGGAAVVVEGDSMKFNGSAMQPPVSVSLEGRLLSEGDDYSVSYTDNVNAGTAKAIISGKGAYAGKVESPFTISPASLSGARLVLAQERITYDGTDIRPKPAVVVGGKLLKEGLDYSLAYPEGAAVDVGAYTVKAVGKGNYDGSVEDGYSVVASPIAGASASGLESVRYTGSPIEQAPTVALGNAALKRGVDYDLSFSNNVDAGTADVLITATGNYTGQIVSHFTIEKADSAMAVAAKALNAKAKKLKKKKMKVAVSKAFAVSQASGPIVYSVEKYDKKAKKKLTVDSAGNVILKKGLKKGNYSIKVKVFDGGDANHNSLAQLVTLKVKVK